MTTFLERAVHSIYCACLSWAFVKFCVCPSFLFDIEGRMWVVTVFISDHSLPINFDTLRISRSHNTSSLSGLHL